MKSIAIAILLGVVYFTVFYIEIHNPVMGKQLSAFHAVVIVALALAFLISLGLT